MQNYRSGDKVLLEIPAVVIRATADLVRVRFGEVEYDAEPNSLMMIKRSMHVGDDVVHQGREGKLTQALEDGVFLIRYAGATGAEAYGVAAADELQHAGAAEAAAPAAPAPEPQPKAAAPAAKEPLDLVDPLPEAEQPAPAPAAEEPAGTRAGGITEMATSLSGVLGRGAQRRQPLNLESLGTTETVPDVREPRAEMVLGDDMRLKTGDE